jgi:AcrR family transcriptional regulator
MPRRKAADVRHGYHHGALREALIAATDELLDERGAEGFSLREVARRSGVAPSAPAHHFGDATGLLVAVATLAFDGLTAALQAGNERGGADPVARLREQGVGYVGFALRYPGRFNLMFRKTDRADAALHASAGGAYRTLESGVRELFGVRPDLPLSQQQSLALLSIWSVVHGFAHLAIAGQLNRFAGKGGTEAFVRAALGPMLQQQFEALRAGRRFDNGVGTWAPPEL